MRGFLFYIIQLPHTALRASLLRPLFLFFYTLWCSFYFMQWHWFCNTAVHACPISFTYIFSKGIYQHSNSKQIFIFLPALSAFLWPVPLLLSLCQVYWQQYFSLPRAPDSPAPSAKYHKAGIRSAELSPHGHARYYLNVSARCPVFRTFGLGYGVPQPLHFYSGADSFIIHTAVQKFPAHIYSACAVSSDRICSTR